MKEELAKAILRLAFSSEDEQRMQFLADQANAGALTTDEQLEIDSYKETGHLVAILKSKAREWLRKEDGGGGGG